MGSAAANIDRTTGVSYGTRAPTSSSPSSNHFPFRVMPPSTHSSYEATLNANPHVRAPTRLPTAPPAETWNPDLSPTSPTGGGSGSWGSGGSGGGQPAVNWNALYSMIGATKPQDFKYTDLNLPQYNAPKFYDFDPSSFNTARSAVNQQIEAGRGMGNQAYDDAMYEMQQLGNPFGTTRTTNPGVRDAMARMMQANGMSADMNAGVDREGVQADQAFGNVQALLSAVNDQRRDSNVRGLGGDQRRFNEGLGQEQRMLNTSIDLALSRARSQYDKDLFAYGKAEADRRYEVAVQQAIANNQGRNQASQANVASQNAWRQSAANPVLDLIAQGRTGVDVSKALAAMGLR